MTIFEKKIVGIREQSLERFVLRARKAIGMRGRVDVLITGSAAMRALNARFRAKNKATDVLSFPTGDHSRRKPQFAGEIAVSADIAMQNAKRLEHSVASEIKVLILHGILHLAGFDHERDNGKMARKEAQLRRMLKLPVALIERRAGPRKGLPRT